MTKYVYHLIDSNTGEEIYASDDFKFLGVPQPEHRIHDANIKDHFGAVAVVNRVEEAKIAGSDTVDVRVYIDAVEEQLNTDNADSDQSYRRF